MNFHVLSLFPDMVLQGMNTSITGRAIRNGKMNMEAVDIRDFTLDKNRRVDDYTYGGGAGMLMQAQPVYDAWKSVADRIPGNRHPRTIYVTPQGRTFTQQMAEDFAKEEDLVILCGHYEGIDERVLEEVVTDYVSIGDYVLTGGELAAMVIMDAVSRLVPGVLHNEDSAETESFSNGLLEYPQYSRPVEWHGKTVPEVLQSGNQRKINAWRLEQSIARTKERRPDLYAEYAQLEVCKEALLKQKRLHIDMIELINRGRGKFLYFDGDEMLLMEKRTGIAYHTMFSALHEDKEPTIFTKFPELLEEIHSLVAHQRCCMEYFAANTKYYMTCPCYQALCTRREKLPVLGLYHPDGKPMDNGLVLRPLTLEYTKQVADMYHLFHDEDYIAERIASGEMFGAFIGEELAGFIGFHDEGSLGMLEVAEKYRRLHIGMALETYAMNYSIERGMIPYGQVIEGNEASAKLQEKMGLYLSETMIYWMHEQCLEMADPSEKEEILALYNTVKEQDMCPWNEGYPTEKEIDFDLRRDALFVIYDHAGICGTISIDADPQVEELPCWNKEWLPAAEISRLCVRPDKQNQGKARKMLLQLEDVLRERGYQAAHYLVAAENEKAIRSYAKLEYTKVGECHMYGEDFLCYEKAL